MARTVAIGIQDFADIIKDNCFYIDKTSFIKEWWESRDSVTLITRPRRFGKTLNMSMLDYFFSVNHADKGYLFEGLEIWNDEKYRKLQGTYPVIYLSFANIKERNYIIKMIFCWKADCLENWTKDISGVFLKKWMIVTQHYHYISCQIFSIVITARR